MANLFNVPEEEKNRIRNLHLTESENKKISSVLNDETVTNIISEGPLDGRGVIAKLCCSDISLGYWVSNNPLPAVITASNGNRGAMYINHHKMTINGNKPEVGDYFRAIESEGGSPTGNNPNGESSGLIYRVTSVSAWNVGTTYNFPNASGCPNCPGISSWSCQVSGNQGTCTEVPGNNAPYATEQDCLTAGDPNCNTPPSTWDCQNGNCVAVQGPGGQYASYIQCHQNCSVQKWKCDGNYNCVQDPNGPYTTQQDCQQNCVEPDFTYDCNMTMGQCNQVPGGGGQYPDLATCNQACEYDGKWTCKEYNTHWQEDRKPKDKFIDSSVELRESTHFNPMPGTGWHCVKDPNGIHNTKQACEAQCPPVNAKIDCVNCEQGIMTQVTAPDTCPPGFAPVTDLTHGPCVQCDNTVCTPCGWCYGTSPMTFNSMGDCQASPNCSAGGGYTCQGNQCIADPNSTQTLAQCQANCPPGGGTYKCNLNVGCSQDPTGQYTGPTALQDCETDCCAQTITSWSWPPYQSGNPTCNEICAKLNTPAMIAAAGGNPLNFRHKCRYDWLILTQAALACPPCSASNGCCDNTGYLSATMAPQYQVSSSPYCLNANSNFIPMVTDAMNGNNAQNTPYGCTWLNTVQGTLLSQLPAPNAGTQCNKEGRISWLDELMTTGTAPGFTPNMTTMTALYPNGVFVPC